MGRSGCNGRGAVGVFCITIRKVGDVIAERVMMTHSAPLFCCVRLICLPPNQKCIKIIAPYAFVVLYQQNLAWHIRGVILFRSSSKSNIFSTSPHLLLDLLFI